MFQIFILCSGLAALTNVLVGHVLYGVMGMDGTVGYPFAVAFAFLAGMCVSFVLNRRYTFTASGRPVTHEIRDFAFVSAGGLAITTGIAFFLREFASLDMIKFSGFRIAPENTAHILAVGITAIYSFFGHKLISFGDGSLLSRLIRDRTAPMVAIALLVAILATRPFRGVADVSLLYAAQALNAAGLADFSSDPYFAFGNQGSFSLFDIVYANLIQVIGLANAALFLWLCAMGLWASGIWRFARAFTASVPLAGAMMISTFVLFPGYGPMNIGYAENLPIPRVFAEAMSLHALALAVNRRFVGSGIILVLAALVHPIMAAVSGAVWLHLMVGRTVYFLVLCTFSAAVGWVLGYLGVSPFTWLLTTYDTEWFSLIHFKNMLVFPTTWEIQALFGAAFPATIIALTLMHGNSASVRFMKALVATTAFLLALSIVGADLLGNRLITAIQTWRILFLVAVAGNLMFIPRILEIDRRSLSFWLLLAAAISSAIEAQFRVIPFSSGLLAGCFILLHFSGNSRKSAKWLRIPIAAVASVAMASMIAITYGAIGRAGYAPVLALLCVGLVCLAIYQIGKGRTPIFMLVAALTASFFLVDARTMSARAITDPTTFDEELIDELTGKNVYWEAGLGYLWLSLRQPSFHSCLQTSGIAFFRDQALETMRRAGALRLLNTSDFYPNPGGRCLQKADPNLSGPMTTGVLEKVCTDLPELDVIITHKSPKDANLPMIILDANRPSSFGLLGLRGTEAQQVFFRYECENTGR